jgi:hypothetical protein
VTFPPRTSALAATIAVVVTLVATAPATAAPIGFGKSVLHRSGGASAFARPTTLQFGPDDRLYVGMQNGLIQVFEVDRQGANDYVATLDDQITAVKGIQNHNDDGDMSGVSGRLVTGILVAGSSSNPVIYATSSDPRIGGGSGGTDTDLDTNSGTLSRLTWTGSAWQHKVLIRGLPRSEENHGPNGMALGPGNTLYIAQGGHTNKGATSNNFAELPEYALSAAILAVDLDAIGDTTYDLPTLNDGDRPGNPDANDPFGGNDGENQAKQIAGGPVEVHAPGFRNAYDLVITDAGNMYTVDNGPNGGWGDVPDNEGPAGNCTNGINEPGTSMPDVLHLVTSGYYGGHPNPTRGNDANTFGGQSPIGQDDPRQCDYQHLNDDGPGLTTMSASTNGIDEYTTSNFDGAMQGDLVMTGFTANEVQRVQLNAAGTAVTDKEDLFSTVGTKPLDLDALGSSDPFPGTIWVADIADDEIYVFEPNDFGGGGGGSCTGADDPSLDEDGDGYDNADEIDNGTNPCSAADVPPDNDGDDTSDLNDPNDDNDGLTDKRDPFAIDPSNGRQTQVPVLLSWENDDPDLGGIANTGFTGLMINGQQNYRHQFSAADMTVGGAAGVLTVDEVPDGSAYRRLNSQKYGFQFGLDPPGNRFIVSARVAAPFAGIEPEDAQSIGLFIGGGSQSSYVEVALTANGGNGGVRMLKELRNTVEFRRSISRSLPGPDYVDLSFLLNPARHRVVGRFRITTDGEAGPLVKLGSTTIRKGWVDPDQTMAVGIIATSRGTAPVFPATWDFIRVVRA